MPIVEFHCHTRASEDSLTDPARLVETCRRKGIDRVVITDHNTLAGARAAFALDPELVIVGEEILTTRGEIVAAFVKEEIPAGLTPQEAVRRLREQGAFISMSHPFDDTRDRWSESELLELLPMIDAIEVFNSRCLRQSYNSLAHEFAQRNNIAGTVGSDAHAPFELGRSVLELDPFEGPGGLRQVIRRAIPRIHPSPAWVHLYSRYATIVKALKS